MAADRRVLFTLCVWQRKTVFTGKFAGHQAAYHRRGVSVQNVLYDRLASWLRPCTRTADLGDDQDPEPIDIESDLDRAVRGPGGADRLDGHRGNDAGGIFAAASPHHQWAPSDSGRHVC